MDGLTEGRTWQEQYEWLLDRECIGFGCKVRNLSMRNGHCLVFKVPMSEWTDGKHGLPVNLPQTTVRRSVGNLIMIKALVLRASSVYNTVRGHKIRWFDNEAGKVKARWEYTHHPNVKPMVEAGDGVVYNSYNVGKIYIDGLDLKDPLAIVREIDIECSFPAEMMERVELSDLVMDRTGAIAT